VVTLVRYFILRPAFIRTLTLGSGATALGVLMQFRVYKISTLDARAADSQSLNFRSHEVSTTSR
jgi:hypothetical protein